MTRREVFFFGAIGGILPILVSILTIDIAPIIDHPESLTLGNYIGYGIRVVGLVAVGGIVALLNPEVRSPISLVQLGIAAPALCTSYINAASPAARPQSALAPFAIVSVANAAEIAPPARIRIADGAFSSVLKDIGAGVGTRLDAVSRANSSVGSFCVTSQGKSPLPGPAAPIGSSCSTGGKTGLVTN
jgi:hypothetical protein